MDIYKFTLFYPRSFIFVPLVLAYFIIDAIISRNLKQFLVCIILIIFLLSAHSWAVQQGYEYFGKSPSEEEMSLYYKAI